MSPAKVERQREGERERQRERERGKEREREREREGWLLAPAPTVWGLGVERRKRVC